MVVRGGVGFVDGTGLRVRRFRCLGVLGRVSLRCCCCRPDVLLSILFRSFVVFGVFVGLLCGGRSRVVCSR